MVEDAKNPESSDIEGNLDDNVEPKKIIENTTDALQKLPPEEAQEVLTNLIGVARHESMTFEGPIPPPIIIRQYEDAVSGSGDRIITMAEKQMNHRHKMESSVINASIRYELLGLILGFLLSSGVIIGGFAALFSGLNVVGVGLIVTPAVTIAGVFVYTQRQRNQQLEQKQKTLESEKKQRQLPDTQNN